MKEALGAGCGTIGSIILCLLVALALGAGYLLWWEPFQIDQHAKNVQHSQQYVETKQSQLIKEVQDYEQLSTEIEELKGNPENAKIVEGKQAQQKAIINRVEEEVQRLPEDQIPQIVKDFLSQH